MRVILCHPSAENLCPIGLLLIKSKKRAALRLAQPAALATLRSDFSLLSASSLCASPPARVAASGPLWELNLLPGDCGSLPTLLQAWPQTPGWGSPDTQAPALYFSSPIYLYSLALTPSTDYIVGLFSCSMSHALTGMSSPQGQGVLFDGSEQYL